MKPQLQKVLVFVTIASSTTLCFLLYGLSTNTKYSHFPAYNPRNSDLLSSSLEDTNTSNTEVKAEFLNYDDRYFSRIVYNRVGKCGSRSMHNIITALAKKNKFNFYASVVSNMTRPNILEIKSEVKLIQSLKQPMLYSRHIHFINFQKFGQSPPLYINVIRDPIERFKSQYYFKRFGDARSAYGRRGKPWKRGEKEMSISDCILTNHYECSISKMWYITPYFCGQDHMCKFPIPESVNRAKKHLIENYLAVGLLEDFEGSLRVFEKLLPHHFAGALEIWKGLQGAPNMNTSTIGKEPISDEAVVVLKKRLTLEYDFYNFTKAIFNNVKAQLHIKTLLPKP